MGSNIDININFGGSNQGFQSLIDNTNKLNQSIGALQQSIGEYAQKTTSSNSKAQKSVVDYAGSYKTLSTELQKNRTALKEELSALEALRKTTGATTESVEKQVSTVRQLEASIKSQSSALSQYNKLLGQTNTSTKTANSSAQSLTKTFNSLGAVLGISLGAYGAFRGIVEATKVIADFELAQKKLRSVLGETAVGMKEIQQSAIDVGRASIFGAKGVTDLQIELAKMGFTKGEIMAMQGAIVNLATATQEELAPSAEVVANILRAFNLTAADSSLVVDQMGKAFNDSALDLSNFREAIKYVAPIAAQANFTFADTVSLLEALSNVGIKGSLAGTSLTNILSRLGDENSKFSKTLGRTVNGLDEFLAALIELRDRGVNINDTFELVDRRAAATFSTLITGVKTVEEFRQKLEEASGVMEEQAAVQLESITYQARLFKEEWKSLVIELDEGSGVVSGLAKALINLGSSFVTAMSNVQKTPLAIADNLLKLTDKYRLIVEDGYAKLEGADKDRFDKANENARIYYASLVDLDNKYAKEFAFANSMPFGTGAGYSAVLKNKYKEEFDALRTEFKGTSEEVAAVSEKVMNEAISPFINEFNSLAKSTKNVNLAYDTMQKKLFNLRKNVNENSLAAEIYTKAIEALVPAYDKIKGTGLPDTPSGDKGAAAKKAIQLEIDLLRLRKENAAAGIDLLSDDLDERIKILDSNYEYDLQIADKEVKTEQEKVLKKSIITKKYFEALKEEYAKYDVDVTKFEKENAEAYRKMLDENQEALRKSLKEDTDIIADEMEDRAKRMSKNAADASKLAKDNPIMNLLFPNMFKINTDDNGEGADGLKDNIESIEKFADIGVSQVDKLVDSWVDGLGRIVDARKEMVDEAENALQTEIELAKLGFASNVTLKQQELAEAKKLRREAIEDQQRAQKIQLAMDSASQLSSLTTAAAEYFAANSQVPVVGVALALAAITTMFAAFAKFKNLAKEQSAVKYEKGGWINGNRHSQGGVHIEAEGGEYVINRNSALKHKTLIEAINKDKIGVDRMYIDGLKNGVIAARVSLDDSQDLKAIRKALETKGKSVEYAGEYKIVKVGNVTTRIKINKYV